LRTLSYGSAADAAVPPRTLPLRTAANVALTDPPRVAVSAFGGPVARYDRRANTGNRAGCPAPALSAIAQVETGE